MMKQQLQHTIMRRVYYAYALRLALHPVTLHGAVTLALAFALTYFVSVPNVLRNLLEVQLGELVPYTVRLFLNTEVWTLIILGGIIFTLLSLRWKLRASHFHKVQAV